MLNLDFSSLTPAAIATLASGMAISLQVAGTALAVGLVWGTMLAMMRLSHFRMLSLFATVYINLFRSIPLAMVLLSFYLIVPQMLRSLFDTGTDTRLLSALVGFALFESAYYAEIIRAGIKSVPKGQLAAAVALGMKPLQAMRLVVLPQAFKNMLPLLLTQLIVLFQDTSLVYVLSIPDFLGAASKVAQRDGRLVEMYLFAAVVYFAISCLASFGVRRLQTRIAFVH